MNKLRLGTHLVSGQPVVEVIDPKGQLVATVCASDTGVNVVSKHKFILVTDGQEPPALAVSFMVPE